MEQSYKYILNFMPTFQNATLNFIAIFQTVALNFAIYASMCDLP